jgi:geranylgeranyl diphosphate synthase type II
MFPDCRTIAIVTRTASRCESDVLDEVVGEIDSFLERTLRSRGLAENLEEAVCYTVLGPGKRLRPALVLLCCEAVEGSRSAALGPAAALELIHNFSLVHDDLPAMDDDKLRRGRPTLHVQAGEAMAILGGDVMMSLAFELIADAHLPPDRKVQLVRELAVATTAMVNGQVFDTLGGLPAGLTDEQRLLRIHQTKTGALLRAACRMGGACGDADDGRLDALTRYGEAVGLMFQIVDDLLDVEQSTEHIGKAAGKDIAAGKLTYPGVLGVRRSYEDIKRLRTDAHEAIQSLGTAADPLRRLCDDMATRTR